MKSDDVIQHVTGNSTLARARFSAGMLLEHDDLEQLGNYTRDLSRLLFRSLFGCGVVCGLKVSDLALKCGELKFIVGAGLALDCQGNPIEVPKPVALSVGDCGSDLKSPLWVLLCGTSKLCAQREASCGSDEDQQQVVWTRERFGFEVRVVSAQDAPSCCCSCDANRTAGAGDGGAECGNCADPCYEPHYQGECGCGCGCGSGADCDCGCKCVLLARLDGNADGWSVDYRVRRFVRPVLMRDPFGYPSQGPDNRPQVQKTNEHPKEPDPGSEAAPSASTAHARKTEKKRAS